MRSHARQSLLFLVLLTFFLVSRADANDGNEDTQGLPIIESVKRDHQRFYSRNRLLRLGVAFGSGAIMANTPADEEIQDWYRDEVRGATTDDIGSAVKRFGEYKYMVPAAIGSAIIGSFIDFNDDGRSLLGTWGKRATRAYLVGAPPLLLTQRLIGASRPDAGKGSRWDPWKDDNGVSGHAFVGAVPFLTLGQMFDDNPAIKYLSYAASGIVAWSRINEDAHFTSQALLGWYLAWEASHAVFETDRNDTGLTLGPFLSGDGYGAALNLRW